ncbi:MAG: SDR family oxidoreductase [Myxococcota bacterium]
MKVQGTAALVTGGSRGLGEALARELARRGARVVVVARNEAAAEKVAADIRAQGGMAYALAADVGNKQDVYPLAGAAAALVGPIDLLIHNASTLGPLPMPLLMDTECEDLQRVLEVNLVGPFRLTKAVAGNMVLRRRGTVVHLSSDAAVNAYPRWGAYGVSKAAQDHLSRTLAAELADTGVRFVSVDPGEMDTQMHADAMPDADRTTLADPRKVAARIVDLVEEEALPNGSRKEVRA